MLQYRFRTLLVLLAIGPPVLAVAGMMASGRPVHPLLLAAFVYLSLVVVVIVVSWVAESTAASRLTAWIGAQTRAEGYCSFCARSFREAGPLAEGPNRVYICEQCVRACDKLIAAEKKPIGDRS